MVRDGARSESMPTRTGVEWTTKRSAPPFRDQSTTRPHSSQIFATSVIERALFSDASKMGCGPGPHSDHATRSPAGAMAAEHLSAGSNVTVASRPELVSRTHTLVLGARPSR